MCVYIYIYLHIYIYIYSVHISVYIHIYIYIYKQCLYVDIYVYMHILLYTKENIYIMIAHKLNNRWQSVRQSIICRSSHSYKSHMDRWISLMFFKSYQS